MTPATKLLSGLRQCGVTVLLDSGVLRLANAKSLPARVVDRLGEMKAEVVAVLEHEAWKNEAAGVGALLDRMAAENEARREWFREPVPGWRQGRLEIQSVLTRETRFIDLRAEGEQ